MRPVKAAARWSGRVALSAILAAVLLTTGCGNRQPIRVGFLGGLTGDNADLGEAGRNGVILAVEEINARGGIDGRMVTLVIRDGAYDAERTAAAAREIVDAGAVAIIGPFTTTTTIAAMSVTEQEEIVLFSPTASGAEFVGRDDYLFRLNSDSTVNAGYYGDYIATHMGMDTAVAVVDQQNRAFSEVFTRDFRSRYQGLGGRLLDEVPYGGSDTTGYDELIQRILAPGADAIMIVANSVDVARLAQQLRRVDDEVALFAVEWAGTQQLIELGGRAVEGMTVLQVYDRFGTQPAFVEFVRSYRSRFGTEPSFSGIIAYEVMQIIAEAWEKRAGRQTLKESILANSPYDGLQQQLEIDEYGDSARESHFVVIRNSQFEMAP